MSSSIISARSGREAAIARRIALSAGKAALPPSGERVRTGERSAATPAIAAPAAPTPAPAVPAPAPAPAPPAVGGTLNGRLLSIQRRRLASGGKAALLAGTAPNASVPAAPRAAPEHVGVAAASCDASCREQARARRAALSKHGRGSAEAAAPSRPPRQGSIEFAPKVTDSTTQSGQRVTGLRIGAGPQVTGDERGTAQPVSGTQYIGTETAAAWRAGGPKVGQSRTPGGLIVSGTQVRSKVRITGDEAGANVAITGEADQRLDDDLTTRRAESGSAMAQFQRQADPHGQSVFGGNLGRNARGVGSRDRQRQMAVEATESGLSITGSAVGRSVRVTGDETGACRGITGTQYLAPARAQAECGGSAGGSAPAALIGASRADPVTGAKVSVAQSWGGQRVTGVDIEHNRLVTGDAPGACAAITGTPYQGPSTTHGWCDPSQAAAVEAKLPRRPARVAVTGDAPLHDANITGTARGAARDISGTPYYRENVVPAVVEAPVCAIDERFSVRSPQRQAHLAAGGTQGGASPDPSPLARTRSPGIQSSCSPPASNGRSRTRPAHAAKSPGRAAPPASASAGIHGRKRRW